MALSRVVSEIFNVKNVVTLKSGLKVTEGHWEWYHSTDCVWFPINVFGNFVPKMHSFWDIRLQKFCDLENRVRGPSRSLGVYHCTVRSSIWLPIEFYSNYGCI